MPLTGLSVSLLDPFGNAVAIGELTVADVPGADEHTPSVADELTQRFLGRRIELASTEAYSGPPYSIQVS